MPEHAEVEREVAMLGEKPWEIVPSCETETYVGVATIVDANGSTILTMNDNGLDMLLAEEILLAVNSSPAWTSSFANRKINPRL